MPLFTFSKNAQALFINLGERMFPYNATARVLMRPCSSVDKTLALSIHEQSGSSMSICLVNGSSVIPCKHNEAFFVVLAC